jgi:hypothetical protein
LLLLFKGVYYAWTGGWSPNANILKILLAAVVVIAMVGVVRLAVDRKLPSWIVALAGFQAYYMFFLIVTQVLFGSMYAPNQPAFATARFFALTQPFNIAALYLLASSSLPAFNPALRKALALIFFACMIDWTLMNRPMVAGMAMGQDGFLRFADLASVHRVLASAHSDGIFDGTGVLVYTAADPRIIYPDNVRGFRCPKDVHIAVVRFAALPSELLTALQQRVAPDRVQHFNRFEVDFFTLPRGFELQWKPRPGFVPHV